MTVVSITPGQLLAELIAEAVRERAGEVGVLVRDVPAPDPARLLESLRTLDESDLPLRVAYLRAGGAEAAEVLALDATKFATTVEQAEVWRNDPGLQALIVVIAHGDEPKLSSLEEFSAVTSRDLKRVLVARALGEAAGDNEVQTRWWGMLAEDDACGLGQLIEYYLALADKRGPDFNQAASRNMHLLGLLPDPAFFNDPKEGTLRTRLDANRDLIRRMQLLTPKDRRTIVDAVNTEEDPEVRQELAEAVDSMDRAQWEGEGLKAISFDAAQRLTKARSKKPSKKGKDPDRPKMEQAVAVAADSLVNPERHGDVAAMLEGLSAKLAGLEDPSRRPQKLHAEVEDGHEAVVTARQDVLGLISRLLDDGTYGGLVEINEEAMDTILRRFDVEQHLVKRWERSDIRQLLSELGGEPDGDAIISRFDAYDAARAKVLPLLRILAVEPLVAAADPDARAKLLEFVGAYESLNREVAQAYDKLFARFEADADEILSHLLLLETVIVKAADRVYAILAPTHPLYLWHYATYAHIVAAQRERLDDKDKELVADAATNLPNFITSVFVPPIVFGRGGASLPYVGRLGPLPYFGQGTESNSADDGQATISSVIESYLALEPHARLGLRLALVDPPDAGVYLRALASLHERGIVSGAHVAVYRHPRQKLAIELRLDEEDEERVAQIFRAVSPSRQYTFEVIDLQPEEIEPGADGLFHVVVVFDCTTGQANAARPASHPIQPLAVPRRISYRLRLKTVELVPAPGGVFESYNEVSGRLTKIEHANYLSVHQDEQLRAALNDIASRTPCTIVADRQVDRDLLLGCLRIATAREGERDIAAFSRSTAAFRRPLRDVARNYNTAISGEELDDLLAQLSDLLEAGVVMLRPDANGRTNHNQIKGLLGTLIAARWFRHQTNGSRLLISLDSPDARRWLRLAPDPLRADLVGFEWTNDHCTVSVIEVKAVASSGAEYAVTDGTIAGPAIEQMLATRRLLAAIFTPDREDELITTPARREIVREHLYRELTKASYSPDQRKVWSDRLQRLLDGQVSAELRCHLIDVRLGADTATLKADRTAVAHDGDAAVPVRVTELNEVQIEALQQAEISAKDGGQARDEPGSGDGDHPAGPPPPGPGRPPTHSTGADSGGTPRLEPRQGTEADAPVAQPRPVLPQPVNRARALLGHAPGTYGKPQEVWFDPNDPVNLLPNPHVLITGETGSGKTQATKAILADLRQHDIPPLILDFKDDYSDQLYADAERLRIYDPVYEPLPFNPLTPPVDRRSGRANPLHHVHQLGDIVKRIYGLGDQQTYRLREAIKRAYETAGVPAKPFVPAADQRYPTFDAVGEQLNEDKAADSLLGRLSPIFDLGLFETTSDQGFADIMGTGTVVRLGQLPGDETKNSVAEFFLMALYNFLIRQPQTHTLGRLLVLDEAWRLVESPFLEPLMREGRAFGLGVIIASQFPKDLPEAVSGSTATKLFFSQTQLEQIREIQRTIVGKTSGAEADHIAAVQRGLAPLTCILHSKQFPQFVRVAIKPYFERISSA